MAADHDDLRSGAAEIIPADGLDAKLALGRPLRVKLGIDPSRPDLTLGHAVVLGALQRFLEAGHEAILIVGDFTGRVGDPSGRSETRPMLSADEADENAQSYLDQAGLVLDVERATVRRNSEWLAELDAADLIRLASVTTIARMLEREDFRARATRIRLHATIPIVLRHAFMAFDDITDHVSFAEVVHHGLAAFGFRFEKAEGNLGLRRARAGLEVIVDDVVETHVVTAINCSMAIVE